MKIHVVALVELVLLAVTCGASIAVLFLVSAAISEFRAFMTARAIDIATNFKYFSPPKVPRGTMPADDTVSRLLEERESGPAQSELPREEDVP